jgi:DNA polymerase
MDENLRLSYLEAMGIQVWIPRTGTEVASGGLEPDSAETEEPCLQRNLSRRGHSESAPDKMSEPRIQWQVLEQEVSGCTRCELHSARTQTVFGSGSHSAKWMVIGEAPGASEDAQGKPFVGRAGQVLTEMLRAAGLDRDDVFITNILKCRPPGNRDPRPVEVDACEGFLKQQVEMVRPDIILAVGRIAAQKLLKTETPLGRLRGRVHRYGDIPVVVVYHPAYLLRSPLEKRKAWEDLKLAIEAADNGGKQP